MPEQTPSITQCKGWLREVHEDHLIFFFETGVPEPAIVRVESARPYVLNDWINVYQVWEVVYVDGTPRMDVTDFMVTGEDDYFLRMGGWSAWVPTSQLTPIELRILQQVQKYYTTFETHVVHFEYSEGEFSIVVSLQAAGDENMEDLRQRLHQIRVEYPQFHVEIHERETGSKWLQADVWQTLPISVSLVETAPLVRQLRGALAPTWSQYGLR